MIVLALWVMLFIALGIAGHFFGVDSRDADYSARFGFAPAEQARPDRATSPGIRCGEATARNELGVR